MAEALFPTAYIPHGGGPCFFMEWDPPSTWNKMGDWLRSWPSTFNEKPKAVLVISAHWEEAEFSVTSNPNPSLIYDYSGFPAHTYEIKYDAPGSPHLAQRIADLLGAAGVMVRQDAVRGFDHGVFIPFKLVYPQADIPIVQLSLKRGLDPAEHIRVGQLLAPLRKEGVLIVGSGMSYHNLREFFRGGGEATTVSKRFDDWLESSLITGGERNKKLIHWFDAPGARAAHPREEHLIPLMVVAGAAGDDRVDKVFTDNVMGATVSAFQFG